MTRPVYGGEDPLNVHIAILIFTVLSSLLLLLPPKAGLPLGVCKIDYPTFVESAIVTLHANPEDENTYEVVRGKRPDMLWGSSYLRGSALCIIVISAVATLQFFVSYYSKVKVHKSVCLLILVLQSAALIFMCVALSDIQYSACESSSGLIVKIAEVAAWSALLYNALQDERGAITSKVNITN